MGEGETMKFGNNDLEELCTAIEKAISDGKKSVNNIDTDEAGRLIGTDDVLGAFDDIESYLGDVRSRLHSIADELSNA